MPSITTSYPGCFSKHRGSNSSSTTARRDKEHRQLRSSPGTVNHQDEPIDNKAERKPFSALDVSLGNAFVPQNGHGVKHQPAKLEMDPSNFRPPDDVDWDEFIQSQYENEKEQQGRRQLTNYDNVGPWHNYFLMLGVKTEVRMTFWRYRLVAILTCSAVSSNNALVVPPPVLLSLSRIAYIPSMLRPIHSRHQDKFNSFPGFEGSYSGSSPSNCRNGAIVGASHRPH